MRSYIQFLTTPTADTRGTAMTLHFMNKRYIIGNIHEGLQRGMVQIGARMTKVGGIFVTGRTEWSNMGGLLGMIITMADSVASSAAGIAEEREKTRKRKAERGETNGQIVEGGGGDTGLIRKTWLEEMGRLALFGPPNLNYLLATARRFVFRKGMPLEAIEVNDQTELDTANEWNPLWSDENVKVWAMSVLPHNHSAEPTIESGSKSPRKRSFDEVDAEENDGATKQQLRAQNLQVTQGVVADMFSSQWSLDALFETPLAEVKLPAALFVRDPKTKRIEKYTGPVPVPGSQEPLPNITVLVRKPWPGATVKSLPRTEPAKEAISYIFRSHDTRGKFRPEEARKLKVRVQDYKKLAMGESIVTEDGSTVTPEMVLEPDRPGNGCAVVDVPSVEYVEPLIQRKEWRSEVFTDVGAIIWLLGEGVAANEALRGFMEDLKHLKHVISSPDRSMNRISFDSSASATTRLSQLDSDRYQMPLYNNETTSEMDDLGSNQKLPEFIHTPDRGDILNLMPQVEMDATKIVPLLDIDSVKAETSPELLELATDAVKNIAANEAELQKWADELPSSETEIITLGTGSATPSKYRNVSATLVRVPGYGSVLLDCGENTLGQIQRMYSPKEVSEILRDLRMIWISHMHADHHLGTVSVIRAWYKAVHGAKPARPIPSFKDLNSDLIKLRYGKLLAVVSAGSMLQWLHEYSAVEDFGYSRLAPIVIQPANPAKNIASSLRWYGQPNSGTSASSSNTKNHNSTQDRPRTPTTPTSSQTPSVPRRSSPDSFSTVVPPSLLNLQALEAVPVMHCNGALAVALTFPSGLKLAYSGDCRPSRHFAAIGRGAHVLVHEATFDADLRSDARAKKHSTSHEALMVGAWMRARAVVLTHFSQRYQKVPVLDGLEEAVGKEEGEEAGWEEDRGAAEVGVEDEGVPLDAEGLPGRGERNKPVYVTLAGGGGGQEGVKKEQKEEEFVPDVAPNPPAIASKPANAAPSWRSLPDDGKVEFDPEGSVKAAREMKIAVAFDFMRLRIGDIAKMSYFTPALRQLYAPQESEKDEKVGKPAMEEPPADAENEGGQAKGETKKKNKKEKEEKEKSDE
ncbi:MAG: hypothetical protein M1822_007205 [Bathelium mastoideum]|nr:MAG: hypothetical protein M1822_007205 [Bathelium mastoideum]